MSTVYSVQLSYESCCLHLVLSTSDSGIYEGFMWVPAQRFMSRDLSSSTTEETTKEKGQLYKPTSKFEPSEKKPPETTEIITRSRIELPSKVVRRKDGKKKSNLELFKEELKRCVSIATQITMEVVSCCSGVCRLVCS